MGGHLGFTFHCPVTIPEMEIEFTGLYIYRYLSKDSGHSSMPCANSGTGMLSTKREAELNVTGLLFSLLWTSAKLFTSFEH